MARHHRARGSGPVIGEFSLLEKRTSMQPEKGGSPNFGLLKKPVAIFTTNTWSPRTAPYLIEGYYFRQFSSPHAAA
jgi:hypothetical protein